MLRPPGEHETVSRRRLARWLLGGALLYPVNGHAQIATAPVEPSPPADSSQLTPEPTWQSVRLSVDVEPTIVGCPQQPELTTWVNQLVGRAFVAETAAVELRIRVRHSESDALVVELFSDDPASLHPAASLRRFERALPCGELLRAAALTVSLFAKAPDEASPAAVMAFPESQPDGPQPPASTDGEVAAQPLEPSATGESPVTAVDAVAAPPVNSAPESASSEAALTVPKPSPPPQQEAPRPDAVDAAAPNSVSVIAGAAGLGALGLNPGVGLGGTLHGGVHVSQWELLIRGGYLASSGQTLTPAAAGTVYGSTSELLLAACPTFTGSVVLRLCGSVGPVWVYAKGSGFDRDRRTLLTALTAGASAEWLFALSPTLAFGARVELLIPLAPVRYEVAGVPDASWTMWRVTPRGGLGFEWR